MKHWISHSGQMPADGLRRTVDGAREAESGKRKAERGAWRILLGAAAAIVTMASCSQPKASPLLTPAEDQRAPDTFKVEFETSKGRFTIQANRAWAPLGVDRFYSLVTNRFYDGNKFFRVLPRFVAQFGMHADPDVTSAWEPRVLQDDPVTQSNQEGFVSFATGGPNTRSTQLFINLRDNARLDAMGFSPIGQVVSGMNVVHQLYGGYGEGAPGGSGPDQDRIRDQGNVYLNRFYPRLDSIVRARVVRD